MTLTELLTSLATYGRRPSAETAVQQAACSLSPTGAPRCFGVPVAASASKIVAALPRKFETKTQPPFGLHEQPTVPEAPRGRAGEPSGISCEMRLAAAGR